jgi:hypothetical protein
MVTAVRYSILGSSEVPFGISMWSTGVLALFFSAAVFELFRRGYNLRT